MAYNLDFEIEYTLASDCDSSQYADDISMDYVSGEFWRIGSVLLFGYAVQVGYAASWYKVQELFERQNFKEYLSHSGFNNVSSVIDTESVWNDISSNPDNYSTLEILEKLHMDVMDQLEYEARSTGIDSALAGKGNCFDYSGMLYSSFTKLVTDHPELTDRLNDVRWVTGVAGPEHMVHAWVRVIDESGNWQNFETTVDKIRPWTFFEPSLDSGYALEDLNQYESIVQFHIDASGQIFEEYNVQSIIKPPTGPIEDLINLVEHTFEFDINNAIEEAIPETLVTLVLVDHLGDLFKKKK